MSILDNLGPVSLDYIPNASDKKYDILSSIGPVSIEESGSDKDVKDKEDKESKKQSIDFGVISLDEEPTPFEPVTASKTKDDVAELNVSSYGKDKTRRDIDVEMEDDALSMNLGEFRNKYLPEAEKDTDVLFRELGIRANDSTPVRVIPINRLKKFVIEQNGGKASNDISTGALLDNIDERLMLSSDGVYDSNGDLVTEDKDPETWFDVQDDDSEYEAKFKQLMHYTADRSYDLVQGLRAGVKGNLIPMIEDALKFSQRISPTISVTDEEGNEVDILPYKSAAEFLNKYNSTISISPYRAKDTVLDEFSDLIDPTKLIPAIGENIPVLAGLAVTGKLGLVTAGLSAAESTMSDLEKIQAEEGVDISKAAMYARSITVGVTSMLLESYGVDKVLSPIGKKGVMNVLSRMGIGFLSEGSTEFLQELVQGLGGIGIVDVDWKELFYRAKVSGLTGAATGTVMSGALATVGETLSTDKEYEDLQTVIIEENGQLIPKFRVIKGNDSKAGKIISLEEAESKKYKMPQYRTDLFEENLTRRFQSAKKMDRAKASKFSKATRGMLESFAAARDMDTDQLLRESGLVVQSGGDVATLTLEEVEHIVQNTLQSTYSESAITLKKGYKNFFSVIGENAAIKREAGLLAKAKQMVIDGNDADSIMRMTGWMQVKNNELEIMQWKKILNPVKLGFGIIDFDAGRLLDTNSQEFLDLKNRGGELQYLDGTARIATLEEMLGTDAEIFEAYPQLKDIKVVSGIKSAHANTGTLGLVSVRGNSLSDLVIGITDLAEMAPEQFGLPERVSTIVHEVQHLIQKIETFENGLSPDRAVFHYISNHPQGKKVQLMRYIIQHIGLDPNATIDELKLAVHSFLVEAKINITMERLDNMTQSELLTYAKDISNDAINDVRHNAYDYYYTSPGETEARMASSLLGKAKAIYENLMGDGRKDIGALFSNDGLDRIISMFESATPRDFVHEMAHFFRSMLTEEENKKLKEALGMNPDEDFTRATEEIFASKFLAYLDNKNVSPELLTWVRDLRWFAIDFSVRIKKYEDLGEKTSPEIVKFYNKMLESQKEDIKKDFGVFAKIFYRFWDTLSITEAAKMAGFEQTGVAIKNRYSVQDAYMKEGAVLTNHISKMLGRDKKKMAQALLLAESNKDLAAKLADNPNDPVAKAAKLIMEYFKARESDYISTGGLRRGFKERIIDELITKMRDAANDNDQKKFDKLLKKLQDAEDLEFVHIPLVNLLMSKLDNPDEVSGIIDALYSSSSMNLKGIHRRHTFKIKDLIGKVIKGKDGKDVTIKLEDISLRDVIQSYSATIGNDIALLHIRNAGIQEGAVRPRVSRPADTRQGWFTADAMTTVFKDFEYNSFINAWVKDSMKSSWIKESIHKALVATKMGVFYNPILLPMYNVMQASLDGSVSARGMLTGKTERVFYKGFKAVFENSEEYIEMLKHGGASQPYKNPFNDVQDDFNKAELGKVKASLNKLFDGGLKAIWKLPFRTLRAMYNVSTSLAWTLENGIRMATYFSHVEDGLSSFDAAQLAAKTHGDYADVPESTRRFLNVLFFTPTYKIAMGKYMYDSIRAMGDAAAGKGDLTSSRMAKVVIRAFMINLAFDMMMIGLGWERDKFGLSYYKKGEGEYRDKELVLTWGAPHNLWQKYYHRAKQAMKADVPRPVEEFLSRNKYELHPLWFIISDALITGKTSTAGYPDGEVWNPLDPINIKMAKTAKYVTKEVYRMTKAISGDGELSPEGASAYKKLYGEFNTVMVQALAFVYTRKSKEERYKSRIDKFKKLLDEATGQRKIDMLIEQGVPLEKIEELYIKPMDMRIEEWERRMDALIEEMYNDEGYSILDDMN